MQVGKLLGVRVVAVTGSREKRRWVEERGADLVVAEPDEAVAPALERALGKTVLTANQVTIWEGLRLAGSSLTVPGHGQLLAAAPLGMPR